MFNETTLDMIASTLGASKSVYSCSDNNVQKRQSTFTIVVMFKSISDDRAVSFFYICILVSFDEGR